MNAIHIGTNEALAVLELPAAFAGDTAEYHLHPALLDLATGSALYLIADYGPSSPVYFPIYYKSAVVFRTIPPRFFSHIRSRQRNEADRDVATFDLTLVDLEGMVLAQIDGFSMRKVRDPRDGLGIVGGACIRCRRSEWIRRRRRYSALSLLTRERRHSRASSRRKRRTSSLSCPMDHDGVIRQPEYVAQACNPKNLVQR